MSTAIGVNVNGRTFLAAGSGSTFESGPGARRFAGTRYLLDDYAGTGCHVAILGDASLLNVPLPVELADLAASQPAEFPLALAVHLTQVAIDRNRDNDGHIDLEGLVAVPDHGLWSLSEWDAEQVPEGVPEAVGSGAFAALGAWHALRGNPVDRLERCVDAACAVDLHTTGPVVTAAC